MALVAAEHDPSSRRRVFAVYMQHGVVGALALIAVTILRYDEPARVLDALGSSGPMLALLFFLFAATLSLLKFKLTEQIYVSLGTSAYIAMFPLLGVVLSAWIAVTAAATQRLLGMLQIGPLKVDMRDGSLEWARTLSLFSTYGIPVMAAAVAFELLGGTIPQLEPSVAAAGRHFVCAVLLIVGNNMIVSRVEKALGYSMPTIVKTAIIDSSIYLVTIPYAILTTFAYGSIGWGGVLASAFTGVIVNAVGRNLALVRAGGGPVSRAEGRHGPGPLAHAQLRGPAPRHDRSHVAAGTGNDVHRQPPARDRNLRSDRLKRERDGQVGQTRRSIGQMMAGMTAPHPARSMS